MSRLFTFLLGCHDQPLSTVATSLLDQWGKGISMINAEAFAGLREFMPPAEDDRARWLRVAEYARTGAYADLVRELVALNTLVMQARGGAPWIQLENDRLRVTYRDEHGYLPTRDELENLWVFPYFLDSLRSIAIPLRAA